MQVFGFVGPSGTGKSHRAHKVAKKYQIDYIIDDGLLIKNNKIVVGKSAKTEATKIASVKAAIFLDPVRCEIMKKTIIGMNPDRILILGTSDEMVDKIASNLGMPQICHKLYIQEFATEEEMALAKKTRTEQGKHVIPVPTLEIKEQFSGYFIDPLKIFRKNKEMDMPDRSIIRPTFSYLGNYTISDTVIRDMTEHIGLEINGIHKVMRTRIEKYIDGMMIDMDIVIDYGKKIPEVVLELQNKIKEGINKVTGINIFSITVNVKGINLPK